MGVNVHIDGLDDELAAAVAERVLDEIEERLAGALRQADPAPEAGTEVLGIRPFDLYPVAFVAERWGVSKDYVRKMPAEDLPRAPWHGGEIRYRGLDILRYEGVDVEHLLPSNVHAMRPDAEASTSPPSSERRRPSSERNQTTDNRRTRPYNRSLPKL